MWWMTSTSHDLLLDGRVSGKGRHGIDVLDGIHAQDGLLTGQAASTGIGLAAAQRVNAAGPSAILISAQAIDLLDVGSDFCDRQRYAAERVLWLLQVSQMHYHLARGGCSRRMKPGFGHVALLRRI